METTRTISVQRAFNQPLLGLASGVLGLSLLLTRVTNVGAAGPDDGSGQFSGSPALMALDESTRRTVVEEVMHLPSEQQADVYASIADLPVTTPAAIVLATLEEDGVVVPFVPGNGV